MTFQKQMWSASFVLFYLYGFLLCQLQSLGYISRKRGGERYCILMEDYENKYIYIFFLEHALMNHKRDINCLFYLQLKVEYHK